MLAGTFGLSEAVWNGLIILGITALGNALITSLIPPVEPDKTPARYNISGFRNEMRPDGAVPEIMGSLRYAPPFAASSWSEIVGDLQYIRTAFHFGTGSVELSDMRFGDTVVVVHQTSNAALASDLFRARRGALARLGARLSQTQDLWQHTRLKSRLRRPRR